MLALTKTKNWLMYGVAFAGGMLTGAAIVYLQDPERGRRRRALAKDKAHRLLRRGETALDRSIRDLTNRVQGLIYETSGLLTSGPVSDEVLLDRIRAHIGHLVSNPHAVHTTVKEGVVTLEGPVWMSELDRLLTGIRLLHGVQGVESKLKAFDSPAKIPGLAISGPRNEFELLRSNWAPATRLVAGVAGLALTGLAVRKRGVAGIGLGMLGTGVIARAIVNDHFTSFTNLKGHGREIAIQKTATIDAPIERVFEIMVGPERLPKVMSHLRDVKKTGIDQYEFTFLGPVETPIQCEARITKLDKNKLLEWESVPGSVIRNRGSIHFDSLAGGGTRIHIRMFYLPPGRTLAHAIAEALDADPKHMLDEDLARLKSLLEVGKTHAHHSAVRIEDLGGPVWIGNTKVPAAKVEAHEA